MTVDEVKIAFEPQIKDYLEKIIAAFRNARIEVADEIDLDTGDDEYCWRAFVGGFHHGNMSDTRTGDFTFTITEEAVREGSGCGLSFVVSCADDQGRMIAQVAPHNYQSDLWIDPSNTFELEFRFGETIALPPSEWVVYFKRHHEELNVEGQMVPQNYYAVDYIIQEEKKTA